MGEEHPMIRWELTALTTEYDQHWTHFRHAIDKSYQAFNIHMVMIALLFSAVSLANNQTIEFVAAPIYLVVGVVAFASSLGTISTLVTQRTGYVWHQKVIDVLRERISKMTSGILEPEVNLFYDRRIFNPGTAWFGRVNFVILAGSSVVILCAYLILRNPLMEGLGFILDGTTSLLLAIAVFVLSIQKLYHSVIKRSIDRARKLFCQLQKYENPPKESKEMKHLKRYTEYLLSTEVVLIICTTLLVGTSILFLLALAVCIILMLLTIQCWLKANRKISC
ncbi:MAG: hypothetical protein ACXAEF_02535 [Candidatus Thorarchaeota archaeon]